MKRKKNFLVITGTFGGGKTHFLSALTFWLFENFLYFRYFKESDIHIRIRESMNSEQKGDHLSVIKWLLDDQHTIIDEMAKEPWTAPRQAWLEDIVDYRYNSMMPTIFISNLLQDELREVWGGRACSRLFAKENIIINDLDCPDMRELGF